MNVRLTERLTHDAERLRNEHTRLEALIENYSVQHGQACARLTELLADVPGWEKLFDGGGLKVFLTDKTKRWNSRTEELERLREEANRLQAHLENLHGRRADCAEAFTAKRERLAERLAVVADLLSERANILHGKPVDAAERYFADRRRELAEKVKAATDCRNRLSEKQESLNGAIRQINRNIEQTDGRRRDLLQEVDRWREAAGNISYDQLTDRLGRDNAWLQREKLALKALAEAETAAAATLAERRKNRELLHRAEGKPADASVTAALLQEWIAAKNAAIESGARRLTDLGVALSTDARAREQRKSLAAALEGMSERAENWKKLNLLLGSASGNKFKEMAQGYTLETLLAYASKQLAELAPRYRLQRIPDTLALQVIDVDMLNEVRTVHSLSGGESFLVSLSLALGLSSLSSNRMKVESLFIDEGFGSLDSETLRIAMDALGRLHTQGRKIGVISHVAEMTERISGRINVVRTSNGKSYIQITS